jgi:hypothetical protein
MGAVSILLATVFLCTGAAVQDIAGPGSFVVNVRVDQIFVQAMTRKSVHEIAGREVPGAPRPI